jgi:hypothetical protein
VEFVGYVIWRHKIRIRSSTVKLFKRRWKQLLRQYQQGLLSKDELREIFYSWVAHLSHASPRQANQLIQKLYSQYKDIEPLSGSSPVQSKKSLQNNLGGGYT